jgi:hypothetical protein
MKKVLPVFGDQGVASAARRRPPARATSVRITESATAGISNVHPNPCQSGIGQHILPAFRRSPDGGEYGYLQSTSAHSSGRIPPVLGGAGALSQPAGRLPLQQIPRVLDLLDALNAQFRSTGHEPRIEYDYVRMEWALAVDGKEIARAAMAEDLAKAGLRWLESGVDSQEKA